MCGYFSFFCVAIYLCVFICAPFTVPPAHSPLTSKPHPGGNTLADTHTRKQNPFDAKTKYSASHVRYGNPRAVEARGAVHAAEGAHARHVSRLPPFRGQASPYTIGGNEEQEI